MAAAGVIVDARRRHCSCSAAALQQRQHLFRAGHRHVGEAGYLSTQGVLQVMSGVVYLLRGGQTRPGTRQHKGFTVMSRRVCVLRGQTRPGPVDTRGLQ